MRRWIKWLVIVGVLVGLVVVRRWAWTPALRNAGLTAGPAATRFRVLFARILVAAWAALALSGVAMLVFQAATVQGVLQNLIPR